MDVEKKRTDQETMMLQSLAWLAVGRLQSTTLITNTHTRLPCAYMYLCLPQ